MSGCDVCIGGWDGDYDSAGFSDWRMQKARKIHKCCECNREIHVGETYERFVSKYDGEFWDEKTCEQCAEIATVFSCGEGRTVTMLWELMEDYAFPKLNTASPCFRELSAKSKQFLLDKWNEWKFGTDPKGKTGGLK